MMPHFSLPPYIACFQLVYADGPEVTINVEYNQLDPLLRWELQQTYCLLRLYCTPSYAPPVLPFQIDH